MDYISAHFASADAVEHVRIKVSKQRTFNEHLVEVMCPEKNESIRKKKTCRRKLIHSKKSLYSCQQDEVEFACIRTCTHTF